MTQAVNSSRRSGTSDNPAMVELVEEITNRLQDGEAVDVEVYAAAHPDLAEELRAVLPALRALADLSGVGAQGPAVEGTALGELGDFRILREVGRGGMGVVYEAEQISLGRRVALKVLPFAATMDPRQLQRFHNEARAAASLHHEHIVPVYAVGSERSVHFYAMQFIDGRTLAQLIETQRSAGDHPPEPTTASSARQTPVANETIPTARAKTEPMPRDAAYFRRVAEWGAQAAVALEHAHTLGIVHRDIKPANLMIDGRGKLWVTDFGLARTATDSNLTVNGDMLGTVRYMSPEQALARHGLVDHRTDVYSLGATLYELLTLRSAFDGVDRQELLRQISTEEPISPRRLDRAVPAELETVVLKAMAKEPGDRYATAQELADDLRRWLEDRPIRGRRPGPMVRMQKWSRRHKSVVRALALGLVVGVASLTVSTVWAWHKQTQTEDARQYAEEQREEAELNAEEADKHRRRADENFRKAVGMMNGLLRQANSPALAGLPQTAGIRKAMAKEAMPFIQELLRDENEADPKGRLLVAVAYEGLGNAHSIRGEYVEAAKAYVRSRDISKQLVAENPSEPAYTQLLNRVRDVRILGGALTVADDAAANGKHLVAVKAFRDVLAMCEIIGLEFNGAMVVMNQALCRIKLANHLWVLGQQQEAEQLYGTSLANCEVLAKSPDQVFSGYVRGLKARALASRGLLRAESGRLMEAKVDLQQTLDLVDRLPASEEPVVLGMLFDRARIRCALGNVLWALGESREASAVFRAAEQEWRDTRRFPMRDNQFAWFLATCPDAQFINAKEAVDLAREAVKGIPEKDPWRVMGIVHYRAGDCRRTLGVALYRSGDWKGAAEALEKGAALRQGGDSSDWFFLAMAHWQLRDREKARKFYDKALAWMRTNRPKDEELLRFRKEAAETLGAATKASSAKASAKK